MRNWKFSQKTKLKQKFFTDSEKVRNFLNHGTIVDTLPHLKKQLTHLTKQKLIPWELMRVEQWLYQI